MVTHNIHAQTIERTAIAASSGRGRVEWENLRKAVQSILNLKYGEWFMFALLPIHYYHYYARYGTAAAVGKPKARVPYSAISPSCVKGFPKGLKFGPPSSFSAENLRRIVDAAEDIAFTGMQIAFLTLVIIILFTTHGVLYIGAAILPAHLIEHSYSKPLNEPIKVPPRPKAVYTNTMLSAAGDIKDVYDSLLHSAPVVLPKSSLNKIKKPNFKKPSIGSIVTVVHEGKPVAKASVMEGTQLHGTDIPNGYVKLSIKEMCDETLEIPLQFKGPFDDDDDYLMSGLITAWKVDSLN